MKRILLTGMSGTGTSSVVRELAARGYKAIDADDGWVEPMPDGTQRWNEDEVALLLDAEDADLLFFAGCEENMVEFLPRFDLVVLLSAPWDTMVSRIRSRTDNPFGRRPEELARIRDDLDHVEPRLRAIADHEIVTTVPLDDVVASVLRLAAEA